MEQFFVDPSSINGHEIIIEGKDVNHIKNVLRKRIGDEISVSDGSAKEYRCRIEEIGNDVIRCALEFVKESDTELPVRVHLYQGLPKGDKLETIIQKCVELGVYDVTPVECKRSVAKIDPKKVSKKVERYNAISEAAAKQSKRRMIPRVKEPLSFSDAIKEATDFELKLIPYELSDDGMDRSREIFGHMGKGIDVAVFIGPEGGFDDKEINLATENGFEAITLGRRILRTETAGMTVMSWIVFNMD